MNIFVLDKSPQQSAKWHCDRHVVKMILESAQLLCSVYHLKHSIDDIPYKLTHKNHPCSIWARESKQNFQWLLDLSYALCREYTMRYGKIHKTQNVIIWCDIHKDQLIFDKNDMTPFPLAMPDTYKVDDPIQSYRNYYIHGKAHLHQWKQNKPDWIQ